MNKNSKVNEQKSFEIDTKGSSMDQDAEVELEYNQSETKIVSVRNMANSKHPMFKEREEDMALYNSDEE